MKMQAALPRIFSIFSCETGSLVFAILNLVVWELGVLGGFASFVYCSVNGGDEDGIMLLTVCSQVSFFLLMFGGFLFHGVLMKYSELIKAYLVLGATVLFLSGLALLFTLTMPFWLELPSEFWYYWSPGMLIVIVLGQVVYALILAMIYSTYRKIKDANDLNEFFNKITKIPKRFSVCSSETGTVIFASLNLFGSVLGILGGVAGFIHCYMAGDYQCNSKLELLLCSEISLFIMVFAVFLFHGVLKKHVKHIKVYLVMGLVILFSSNIGFLVVVPMGISYPNLPIPSFQRWSIDFLALTIVLQVAYALILAMIYNTYKKIKSPPKDRDEKKVFLKLLY